MTTVKEKPGRHDERKEDVRPPARKIERPKPDLRLHRKEITEYFRNRQSKRKVIKTTRTPGGQVLDWISRDAQGYEGKIATPPPVPEVMMYENDRLTDRLLTFELQQEGVPRGPEGTVPVLRKNLRTLSYRKSLKDYLSKHGHRTYPMFLNDQHSIEVPGDGAHDYAYTAQFVTNYGGEGYLSAYDPYVNHPNEFSLMQIAVVREYGRNKQTIEAGWQEYKDLYGDWVPHLFIFYTTNGYTESGDNQGGYNQDVDGWVQYSNVIYPGAISSPNSVRGGAQYVMQIKYQLYEGNWWFCCNGHWVGYYPASLFSESGLRTQADKIAFYGEVVDSSDHAGLTRTDMGSGYWPEYEWQWAAYQRSLRYQSSTNGAMTHYQADTEFASDPDLYDLITHFNSGTTWGSYFWMGGPGA